MSLKRGAEKQLTRDDGEEDVEEVQESGIFKKADESALASRPMRGLPKRTAPLPGSVGGASGTPDSKPSFGGGFKGFGASSSSSFTFSSPVNASSTPPVGSTSDSPFKFSTPTLASSASSATKQFASFLSSTSSTTTHVNGMTSAPPSNTSASTPTSNDPQVKYFVSLRGLNLAFKSEIEKAIQKDAFIDLTDALENYKRYREEIEKENPSKKSQSGSGLNGAPTTLFGVAPASTTSTPRVLSMPTPPSSFSFGGTTFKPAATTSAPSAESKPTTNGMGSSTVSGFKFSTPPSTEKASTFNPFSLPSSSTSTPLFGSNSSKPLFDGSSGVTTSPFGSTNTSSAAVKPSTSVFGSTGIFGAKTETAPTVSSSSSIFGNSALTTSSSSSAGFTFGSGIKPSSSPVGFSFGGSPTPEPESSSSAGKGSGESITPKPSTPLSVESRGVTPASTEGGDMEETQKHLGANPNDEEGEGEEDEETLHTSRVKIYRLGMKDDKPQWSEMGVGMLRVKKHKTTGAKRILSRNSATGKIMLNFKLYSGLSCSRTKQSLGFVGHEDGNKTTYRARLKDESDAIALKEAIDKEVSSL